MLITPVRSSLFQRFGARRSSKPTALAMVNPMNVEYSGHNGSAHANRRSPYALFSITEYTTNMMDVISPSHANVCITPEGSGLLLVNTNGRISNGNMSWKSGMKIMVMVLNSR